MYVCTSVCACVSVLGRPPSETLSIEELEPVQTDLEVLLASVGRRLKLLKSEIQILQNWQDKKDSKMPVKGKMVMSCLVHIVCSVYNQGCESPRCSWNSGAPHFDFGLCMVLRYFV